MVSFGLYRQEGRLRKNREKSRRQIAIQTNPDLAGSTCENVVYDYS